MVIQQNQPTRLEHIMRLVDQPPPGDVPTTAQQDDRHGGRRERRRRWAATALTGYLDWPGLQQVVKVERPTEVHGTTTTQTRSLLTRLDATVGPTRLLALIRGHWQIENRRHYVRDVTVGEDASRLRAGAAPRIMATLRHVVLTLLHQHHATRIASTLRAIAWSGSALRLLGLRPCKLKDPGGDEGWGRESVSVTFATPLPVLRPALDSVCDGLDPGCRVVRVTRLHGGITTLTHSVTLARADGARRRVVLRRYKPAIIASYPDALARCWNALERVEEAGVPVPRPLWQDPSGDVFGTPSLLMTHIAGRPLVRPRDVVAHAVQLGETLALIHRTPTRSLVDAFPLYPQHAWEKRLERVWSDPVVATHPRIGAVRTAFRSITPPDPTRGVVLTHGDFWPANVLWRRGIVVGIVDWEDAALDHPGRDIGQIRFDLALLHGMGAADGCLSAYQRAGLSAELVPFWDLLSALPAMKGLEQGYLAGYRDAGRTDLTLDLLVERRDAVIDDALRRIAATR